MSDDNRGAMEPEDRHPVVIESEKPEDEVLEATSVDDDDEARVPKTGLALKVEQMDERSWTMWSTVAGAVIGLIAAACLFLIPSEGGGMFPIGTLIAFAMAMIVPGYIERSLERKAPRMRIALIIALGAALVIYVIVMLLSGEQIIQQ